MSWVPIGTTGVEVACPKEDPQIYNERWQSKRTPNFYAYFHSAYLTLAQNFPEP